MLSNKKSLMKKRNVQKPKTPRRKRRIVLQRLNKLDTDKAKSLGNMWDRPTRTSKEKRNG